MEGTNRVRVFARVRPTGRNDEGSNICVEVDEEARSVFVHDESAAMERVLQGAAIEGSTLEARRFSFDGTFAPGASQRDVFALVGMPVLRECLRGINGTILAYGQTGSGKTHSLLHQAPGGDETGLLPRLVVGLFVHVAQDFGSVYTVEAAAVQVYNEQVDDLLHPNHQNGGGNGLNVQSNGILPGLTWTVCERPDALLELFTRARENLIYAETRMNKASSRSHAVFQIKIMKRPRTAAGSHASGSKQVACTHARLNVVDLAGSERVKKSGVVGAQFKEATAINKSLLAFGNVVSALAAKQKHVPFRDSKLTRILEGSLGGNCKTSMLVCASPASQHVGETLGTLEFASRAMCIEVDATVNSTTVEVSAQALLADLGSKPEDFGLQNLGPELEELRRSSAEAMDRAEKEAKRQQQVASEAASLAKSQAEEISNLRREKLQADAEAERHRLAAENAQSAVWKMRQAAAESEDIGKRQRQELESLRKTHLQTKEETMQARSNSANAQNRATLEMENAQRRFHSELEEQQTTTAATERSLQCELAEQRRVGAATEALARAAADEAHTARRERDEALAQLRAMKETVQEAITVQEAAAKAEVSSLKTKLAEVAQSESCLKTDLAETCERLQQKGRMVDEVSTTLERLRANFESTEACLKQECSEELCRMAAIHRADLASSANQHAVERHTLETALEQGRLRHADELTSLKAAHDCTLCQLEVASGDASARHAVALEAAARRLNEERECWLAERTTLEKAHKLQVREKDVSLEDGVRFVRDAMEERVARMQRMLTDERATMQHELEELGERMALQEQQLQEVNEEALEEAWSQGNVQQRRLAAAFKAARCLAAVKQDELQQAHTDLTRRFNARESRSEDMKLIREQKKRLEQQARNLHDQDLHNDYLARELQNRDENDRIFSGTNGARQGRPPTALRRRTPLVPLAGTTYGIGGVGAGARAGRSRSANLLRSPACNRWSTP